MPFSPSTLDRERDKFVENPAGETSVRVFVSNETGDEIPVTGSFSAAPAPTGPFTITVVTVTDTASNPLASAYTDRVSLSIRNKSAGTTIYVGKDLTVTADDTATGGWEIGPNEDFNIDLDDSNNFTLIAPAGQSATVKILEIAGTGAGGGGGGMLSRISESPTGLINNANSIFSISQSPAGAEYFDLYLDGLLLDVTTHFTRTGTTINMVTAPNFGQTLRAVYWY